MKFPEFTSVDWQAPLQEELVFNTLINKFGALGKETRKTKQLFVKRNLSLLYKARSIAMANTIFQFFIDVKGRGTLFNFFNNYADTYTEEYVGTGDGSTTVYNLPSKSAQDYSLYVNTSEQIETTDYTFASGAGEDGADKLTMVAAVDSGDYLLWSFTGYLKTRARFKEDKLTIERIYMMLGNIGLQLEGKLNDE